MENGAFAPKEQMLHFPSYFQICDISNASKGVIMELRVNIRLHQGFQVAQCLYLMPKENVGH